MKTNETKEQQQMEEHLEERQEERTETSPAEAEETSAQDPARQPEDDRLSELQRQAEENHSRFLRAQADFDNYRRRTQKEKEELAQYASLKLVDQLLPVLDNFERALQSGGEAAESHSFSKGVDMIFRQFYQVLENEGLKKIEAVGQPFDPELHQAIMQVESEEHESGTVVEVVQNGYWMKDKVLRPAMVKVSG
nr:nucleotide exchange factor GrpE [Cohnella pontilimi]